MSVKVIAIPLIAAGVAVVAFTRVLAGRKLATHQAPTSRSMKTPAPLTASRSLVVAKVPQQRPLREAVLPLSFWDAGAALDAEDEIETQRLWSLAETFDSADREDAELDAVGELGARWLTRAIRSDDSDDMDDIDPAETCPDSLSMVSQASRAAAAGVMDASEELDDDAQSSDGRRL